MKNKNILILGILILIILIALFFLYTYLQVIPTSNFPEINSSCYKMNLSELNEEECLASGCGEWVEDCFYSDDCTYEKWVKGKCNIVRDNDRVIEEECKNAGYFWKGYCQSLPVPID